MKNAKKIQVLAINGSPRKNGNCAELLRHAMEGASGEGAETTLLHLCDYQYQGCVSCFRCRRKPEPCAGCGLEDELQSVLQACYEASALLIASPVFFANYPAGVRAFLERLLYHYPHKAGTAATWKPVRLFYAMNATKQQAEALHYPIILGASEDFFRRNFQDVQSIWAYNTYQFEDYAQYIHTSDAAEKRRVRDEEFPALLAKARQAGAGAVRSCIGPVH